MILCYTQWRGCWLAESSRCVMQAAWECMQANSLEPDIVQDTREPEVADSNG